MLRKSFYAFLILIIIVALWLWWNYPTRVEMKNYAPADALLYLEANDLPELAHALASTEAWQTLAPLASTDERAVDFGSGSFNRYTLGAKWLAWTGIGTAEAVVLARAQVAAVVTDFDAAEEDAGKSLNIKLRVALVIESHTSEWRLRAAIEKLVGGAARRAYGDVRFETTNTSGKQSAPMLVWTANNGSEQKTARRLFAVINESVAVVANDEAAARACLAVRRGERPSLATDKNFELMRERVETPDALAFAYVSQSGAAKISQLAILAYAGRSIEDARAQGFIALLAPQIASRFITGGAWSARVLDGEVEDNYFVSMPKEIAPRFNQAFAADAIKEMQFAELLPEKTYQTTLYNMRDPQRAWHDLQSIIVSQMGLMATIAIGKSQFFDNALKSYGIDSPRDFLNAVNAPLVTARLDATSDAPLLIVSVRERDALQTQIRKRLGANARVERIGDAEMSAARGGDEPQAASFVGNYLIFGAANDVRRALQARVESRTLARADAFKEAFKKISETNEPASIVTLTDNRDAACDLFSRFGKRAVTETRVESESERRASFDARAFSLGETKFADDGIEKRTRSYFGLFGALAAQFAPRRE
jgi:hypothetical protein